MEVQGTVRDGPQLAALSTIALARTRAMATSFAALFAGFFKLPAQMVFEDGVHGKTMRPLAPETAPVGIVSREQLTNAPQPMVGLRWFELISATVLRIARAKFDSCRYDHVASRRMWWRSHSAPVAATGA